MPQAQPITRLKQTYSQQTDANRSHIYEMYINGWPLCTGRHAKHSCKHRQHQQPDPAPLWPRKTEVCCNSRCCTTVTGLWVMVLHPWLVLGVTHLGSVALSTQTLQPALLAQLLTARQILPPGAGPIVTDALWPGVPHQWLTFHTYTHADTADRVPYLRKKLEKNLMRIQNRLHWSGTRAWIDKCGKLFTHHQSLSSHYHSIFPCLSLTKSPRSLPFPSFDSSSKYPMSCTVTRYYCPASLTPKWWIPLSPKGASLTLTCFDLQHKWLLGLGWNTCFSPGMCLDRASLPLSP